MKIHLRKALSLGATEQELAEVIGILILMMGAPAEVWPRRIIEEELTKAKRE